uniref:Uncharacterized protein n=1 Tax=viral metagenome TaxID=1070528 RepID=A0A6M3IKY4_9ZZZZ
MAIDLTTFSARTRPVVRQPVYQQVNRMEADYEAAGKSLLAEAGANVLQIVSQQAALSARLKVKAGTDAYLSDYENELSKAGGSDEATAIANKYLTGFEDHKAGLVREAEGGLINSALVGFGKAIEKTSAGERQRVTNGILAVNAQRIEDIALGEYSVLKGKASTPADTAGVLAYVTASRGAFNEKFSAVWNEAVQDHKVMSFESAMLDVYNEKGIEASVAFGRDLNTAQMFGLSNTETTQIVNEFEDRKTGEVNKNKAALELQREAIRSSLSASIYQNKDLTYDQVFDINSPLTEDEKRSTWKEWNAELKRISSGEVVDIPTQDEMSTLYGEYTANPTKANRDAAYRYYQENSLKLPDTQRNHTRIGLLEDDPKAEDKKTIANEGIARINALKDDAISLYKASIPDGEVFDFNRVRAAEDEAARDRNDYRQWMADAREKNITLTDDDHRKKITSLTRPREEKIMLTAMENFSDFGVRGTKLGKKKRDRLIELKIWQSFDKAKQDRIFKILKAGATVEEIMQAEGL